MNNRIDRIIIQLEKLYEETDDIFIRMQLRNVIRMLLEAYSHFTKEKA